MAETFKSIEELVGSTTRLLREQLEASPDMERGLRYAFVVGSLLAFVDDDVKAELHGLIREGLPTAVGPVGLCVHGVALIHPCLKCGETRR